MRAAIEAHDAGADVASDLEAAPDAQPLRRGRGRHQRGARQRGRRQPRDARLRHRQGLRLPRRPGRDRDLHARGAGRHLPARALGRVLLAARGRPARAAPVRRRGLAAHRVRRRHHRPRPDPGALRAARASATSPVYEEYFAWKLVENDDRCQGVICWDLAQRRPEDDRRQDASSSRRAAPGASTARRRTPTRARATGWRWRCGRAAAEGHGVHAVPPDDALPVRDPDHRGLPRRGRLPDQRRRRAVHEALRAERDGARLARRRLALGDDRDRGRAAASTAR